MLLLRLMPPRLKPPARLPKLPVPPPSVIAFPVIPETNGGRGQIVTYTATVTNPGHTANNVDVRFEVTYPGWSQFDSACPPNDGI